MFLGQESFCNFYLNIFKWSNLGTTLFKSVFYFIVLNKVFSLKSKFLLVVRNDISYLKRKKINYYCKTQFDINIVVTPASEAL